MRQLFRHHLQMLGLRTSLSRFGQLLLRKSKVHLASQREEMHSELPIVPVQTLVVSRVAQAKYLSVETHLGTQAFDSWDGGFGFQPRLFLFVFADCRTDVLERFSSFGNLRMLRSLGHRSLDEIGRIGVLTVLVEQVL